MNTITAPETVRQWLATVHEEAEILGDDGVPLGLFKPVSMSDDELLKLAEKLFDPVEMERIATTQHGQGRPLAEIFKDLESRGAKRRGV